MILARRLPLVAVAALAALLAGCANPIKKSERPVELTTVRNVAEVQRLWKASVGDAPTRLRLGLSLAMADDVIYAASYGGTVAAFNKANGKRLWSTSTRLSLTGGPGAGEGLVVAGASHGNLVALDAASGEIKWRAFINSELLSAPEIGNGVVVLRAADGRVAAFSASDGRELWSAEQQVPRLSLRGTSRPLIVGDLVIVGFDNGRLQALRLRDGVTVWDINLVPASGKTELERLNDIDTTLHVHGEDLYVVAFQGKVARISLENGNVVWSRDASSYSGLAVDDSGVYMTTTDGSVARITLDGIEAWKTEVLAWRRLSPPALLDGLVAVADLEGYVHFLDRETGALNARIHPLTARISADPLVSEGTLFMLDEVGDIAALRATPAPAADPGSAPPPDPLWEGSTPPRPR